MAESKTTVAKAARTYNFGEKKEEFVDGANIPVWQSPKYEISRQAAINLLESKEYGDVLQEGDFWILMNKTKSGKMAYTGLIISHDALIKINNALPEDRRFDQKYCGNPEPFEYAGKKGLLMVYRDERDGMLEVGEITPENCKNGYPFAMLFKRTFDRVVKRKANLVGIYSDSEADEFKNDIVVDTETGEVISEKTSTKPKAQTQTIPVPEAPVNAPVAKPTEELSLADALKHNFEQGSIWKGKSVNDLVDANNQTDAAKRKLLNMYVTRGSNDDRTACKVVIAAIEAGKLAFQNSVEAAS